jgi:(1->4)-alpha-D-glucan 1-alpha-D-glucosylmutase
VRAERFPRNLLVTQTHDTKRSGDVRARIGALAGMAGDWAAAVRRWTSLTADIGTPPAPDAVERYFVFQTLVGAWPIEADRMVAYMEKALREAKRNSNWISPDDAHEQGVFDFVRALYSHEAFLADFEPFAAVVARAGDRAALGQLLLKLTVPGLPDIYQGDELLSLSLVDPDNRRPVDWPRRRALLEEVRRGAPPTDETRKLWLIVRALVLRRSRPDAFTGAYTPVEAGERTVAFLRGDAVLTAAAVRGEGDPVPLPDGRWRDVLYGGEVAGGDSVPLGPDGIALYERA